ncbi:hypothetical protein TNCV_1955501 [Trichonephila clavipes]|nr:hypothetical protein TNCV_1955501 [Trichonephila clavipes]
MESSVYSVSASSKSNPFQINPPVTKRSHGYQGSILADLVPYTQDRDEAHFWLNGYVYKQNCRIWSEANPQMYVETPLRPEKLTVWCALWAGGILLQKR